MGETNIEDAIKLYEVFYTLTPKRLPEKERDKLAEECAIWCCNAIVQAFKDVQWSSVREQFDPIFYWKSVRDQIKLL